MSRVALGLFALGMLVPLAARAQASCTLREVEGQKGPGGVDPRLEDVRALLGAPPFVAYPSYRLLETHPLSLKKGVPEKGTLVNRHRFEVTFMERLGQKEGRARLRLRLEVRNPEGRTELNTIFAVDENGQPFPRVEQHGDRLSLQLISCKAS